MRPCERASCCGYASVCAVAEDDEGEAELDAEAEADEDVDGLGGWNCGSGGSAGNCLFAHSGSARVVVFSDLGSCLEVFDAVPPIVLL